MERTHVYVITLTAIGIGIAIVLELLTIVPDIPVLEDGWWSAREKNSVDKTIKPFKIAISDEDVADLKTRLNIPLRLTPPLQGQQFLYGFNTDYFPEVVNHWKNNYDWRKHEAHLNTFPQFVTNIEGLDVHFLHIKSEGKTSVEPLLILHGWPGSIVEFIEFIPALKEAQKRHGKEFDLVIPSLPGFGFSEGAIKPGLGPVQIAQIMRKLMERLGYSKFYLQGGDWGSVIATNLAIIYPQNVKGLHTNMPMSRPKINFAKMILSAIFPFFLNSEEYSKVLPLSKKFSHLLEESGYFHIQATKPDTVGVALSNSPVSLAVYILEKFSTWTNPSYRNLPDGGLTKKYTIDQLLTNIHIYWFSKSITTSMRLYAEHMSQKHRDLNLDEIPCIVPTAAAVFPHELTSQPENFLRSKYHYLIQYTDFKTGGHFAAMEEPKLLANDVLEFIKKVQLINYEI